MHLSFSRTTVTAVHWQDALLSYSQRLVWPEHDLGNESARLYLTCSYLQLHRTI
ncbi:hypothetical protein HYDPIDRAFT_108132, partial [Hydnomerulius pinastri MD-312]